MLSKNNNSSIKFQHIKNYESLSFEKNIGCPDIFHKKISIKLETLNWPWQLNAEINKIFLFIPYLFGW